MSQAVDTREHARQQAKALLESIVEMMAALERARHDGPASYEGEELEADDLEERARELPLSVLVRSGWSAPGGNLIAAEYEVLLCTGGPAVRIRGELSEYGEPTTASLEAQDWFIPWEPVAVTEEEGEFLLAFVTLFWFGG